jgi:peroxiredoxin family protein
VYVFTSGADPHSTAVDIRGVTVSFLRIFVEENKVRLMNMTTADVCNEIIKADTKSERISYIELLQKKGKGSFVGTAIRFISHAWACKFLALVETIFEKCKEDGLDESACSIWLDIFTVNQHSGIEDFEHWTTSFQIALRQIGKAWIIFIPYFPIWLKRSWCLFEMYAIAEGRLHFEILLPSSEEVKFTQFLIGGGKVEDAISEIDIRKAEAFKQSDQDNINKIGAGSMGHGKLNELITTEMLKWYVSCAETELCRMHNNAKFTSDLHLNAVKMYMTLGSLAVANTELDTRCEHQLVMGADPLKIAETMCEMGTVKWKLGQLETALSVLREARLIYEKSGFENLELLGNITNRIG